MRYLLAGSFLVLAFAACSAQKQPDGYLMQAKAAPGGMYVDAVSSEKERADLRVGPRASTTSSRPRPFSRTSRP